MNLDFCSYTSGMLFYSTESKHKFVVNQATRGKKMITQQKRKVIEVMNRY